MHIVRLVAFLYDSQPAVKPAAAVKYKLKPDTDRKHDQFARGLLPE